MRYYLIDESTIDIIYMTKRILVILAIIYTCIGMSAQSDTLKILDYGSSKVYEIGGIEIEGAENRDRNAIKSIAGISEGKKLKLPGSDIPNAIRSLMKLKLFDDVQILKERVDGDVVFLKLILVERPTLSRYSYKGIKKSHHDDLNDIVKNILNKGGIVTEAQKILAKNKIKEHYVDKGRLDVAVKIEEIEDKIRPNSVRLVFDIDRGERIKIDDITFEGNSAISDYKLRKNMKETKRKCTWFKKSKMVKKTYEEDKKALITYYNSKGFRDAKIIKDSIWRDSETGNLRVDLKIDEGNKYYYRDIKWKGNTIYTDEQLSTILGIKKGDVFNPSELESRLKYSMDGRDVSTLYMDDGYLFFQIDPVEVAVENDSIDLQMRISEGPQATIANVTISGNDRTNENVIRRQLRTRPGQKFSRSQIIRSQREIVNLGYFNPETIGINTPVNPQRGTVDIDYTVEERPADQLELSAGYGGQGLIGTLGVTFNNFSIQNIKDRSTWNPLPQGDGQKLSLRLQSNSRAYRTLNFTFTEPWLGGKSPTSLTVGANHTALDYSAFGSGKLGITRLFGGLGKQLRWPDDYFSISSTVNLERIRLDNYGQANFPVTNDKGQRVFIRNGVFNNLSLNTTLTRSSINDPLYPRRGSKFSVSLQLTPPYSLFKKESDVVLTEAERADIIRIKNEERGPANRLSEAEIENLVFGETQARKFRFLEYHKWKISTEWYFNVIDKLVFKADAKFGFLGSYNSKLGAPPFERFQLGGDGLQNQNQGVTGVEVISLRGYDADDINNGSSAVFYDKFNVELRYPLSLNPSSTIYFKTFFQAGNSWNAAKEFNPFEVKKSVGVGLRVFLPMFGLLGFDYGIGLDRNLPSSAKFSEYGEFHIILGFEPE